MDTFPSASGALPFTFLIKPVTADAGIDAEEVKAEVPFPIKYPVNEVAPLPPLATPTVPVTLDAVPETLPMILPVTLPVKFAVIILASKFPDASRFTS